MIRFIFVNKCGLEMYEYFIVFVSLLYSFENIIQHIGFMGKIMSGIQQFSVLDSEIVLIFVIPGLGLCSTLNMFCISCWCPCS